MIYCNSVLLLKYIFYIVLVYKDCVDQYKDS